ncbi:MAG: hypothetical protein Q9164_006799, partial [Protoblastenia rupestris]
MAPRPCTKQAIRLCDHVLDYDQLLGLGLASGVLELGLVPVVDCAREDVPGRPLVADLALVAALAGLPGDEPAQDAALPSVKIALSDSKYLRWSIDSQTHDSVGRLRKCVGLGSRKRGKYCQRNRNPEFLAQGLVAATFNLFITGTVGSPIIPTFSGYASLTSNITKATINPRRNTQTTVIGPGGAAWTLHSQAPSRILELPSPIMPSTNPNALSMSQQGSIPTIATASNTASRASATAPVGAVFKAFADPAQSEKQKDSSQSTLSTAIIVRPSGIWWNGGIGGFGIYGYSCVWSFCPPGGGGGFSKDSKNPIFPGSPKEPSDPKDDDDDGDDEDRALQPSQGHLLIDATTQQSTNSMGVPRLSSIPNQRCGYHMSGRFLHSERQEGDRNHQETAPHIANFNGDVVNLMHNGGPGIPGLRKHTAPGGQFDSPQRPVKVRSANVRIDGVEDVGTGVRRGCVEPPIMAMLPASSSTIGVPSQLMESPGVSVCPASTNAEKGFAT